MRLEIVRELREGGFDVLVGINLLREGLDLPEVALVAILDADREGFLRSETALIQTFGRAARNLSGRVVLYADRETEAIRRAVKECNRRRAIQEAHNRAHHITPRSQGGNHDSDNLTTLCWFHHHVVIHRNGYQIDPDSLPQRRRFLRSSSHDPP